MYFIWLRHQKCLINKCKYCKLVSSWWQDAATDTHQSYFWPENTKRVDRCDSYRRDHFHAQPNKAGLLTLQLLPGAGNEDLVNYTKRARFCIQQPQRGAWAREAPRQMLERPRCRAPSWARVWMPSGGERWGRDENASDDRCASTNEYINERIKKGWGHVAPIPSPTMFAPVLRGVAWFG